MTLIPRVLALLKAADADDIALVVGGVFPDEDIPEMKALGVAEVLPQDTPPEEIIRTIRTVAAARSARVGAR
jgi:methylmalonyl-CoA mutase cobalamin-binding domain/chain